MPDITTISDVFVPQVLGPFVQNYLFSTPGLLSSGYVGEIPGVSWDSGGSTVTFPSFNGKLEAVDLPLTQSAVETAVAGQKVSYGSTTEAVLSKIIPFESTYSAMEDALQRGPEVLMNDVGINVAEAVRDCIESALITEARTTTLGASAGTDTITAADIIAAKAAKWGDKLGRDAALVMHSTAYGNTIVSADVLDASKFGAGSVQSSGAVGVLAGCPLFVSDKIPYNDVSATYDNILVARNMLGYAWKRDVQSRKIELANDRFRMEFTFRFCVHLFSPGTLAGTIILGGK